MRWKTHSVRFDEVLEAVEALPEEQQNGLIDIVRRRQIERRRDALVASVRNARRESAEGAVRRGSSDDLLASC